MVFEGYILLVGVFCNDHFALHFMGGHFVLGHPYIESATALADNVAQKYKQSDKITNL